MCKYLHTHYLVREQEECHHCSEYVQHPILFKSHVSFKS